MGFVHPGYPTDFGPHLRFRKKTKGRAARPRMPVAVVPHKLALDHLPHEVLLRIFVYAGITNGLPLVNRAMRHHLHFNPKPPAGHHWPGANLIYRIIKHNYTYDLNVGIKYPKLRRKTSKLPEERRQQVTTIINGYENEPPLTDINVFRHRFMSAELAQYLLARGIRVASKNHIDAHSRRKDYLRAVVAGEEVSSLDCPTVLDIRYSQRHLQLIKVLHQQKVFIKDNTSFVEGTLASDTFLEHHQFLIECTLNQEVSDDALIAVFEHANTVFRRLYNQEWADAVALMLEAFYKHDADDHLLWQALRGKHETLFDIMMRFRSPPASFM